jgi:hypothetical protein
MDRYTFAVEIKYAAIVGQSIQFSVSSALMAPEGIQPTATVHVSLYEDATNIATGQGGITLDAAATDTITASLSWSQNKNATKITSATIVIKE